MSDDRPSSSGTFSAASMSADVQEVKGLVFETIRDYMLPTYGKVQWDNTLYMLPSRTCEVIEHPEIAQWYPESELRRIAHLIFDLTCKNDEVAFQELSREIALAGIRRFFRMIPDLASGKFVLRNIPTFFGRVRRGTATVTTETADDGRVLIHYKNYRYCRDKLYRLMALATCQAAVLAATGKVPEAKVDTWDRSSMTLSFLVDE